MGVMGLTTYSASYFEPFKLQSTLLIIDGGLSISLGVKGNYDTRLGGDYRKIHDKVYEMFSRLQECGVTPIVIEDGHYKLEKIETMRHRSVDRLQKAINYKEQNYDLIDSAVAPLLHLEAINDALSDLNVCCCRAEFDADEEIMELARKLNCPVVSQDSDFCLGDGVSFIHWDTLDFDGSEPYVKCLKFNRERFLEDHGVSQSVLPFLSVLFPSDYSKAALYYKIFPEQNKLPHIQKYPLALGWLKNKTAEETMEELLKINCELETEINFAVRSYTDCAMTVVPVLEQHPTIQPFLKNVRFNVQENDLNKKYNVPLDIANRLKHCALDSSILYFFVSEEFECRVNICEDVDEKSVHEPAIRLIKGIYGLLLKYLEKPFMKLITREGQRLKIIMLRPLIIKNHENFKILFEIMDISHDIQEDLQLFDHGWAIFILTLIYLRNKCGSVIKPPHVHSFILAAFALQVRKFSSFTGNPSFPVNLLKELKKEDCRDFLNKKMASWEISRQDKVVLRNISHIHIFITYQACLFRVMEIFSLLNLPHKIRVADFLAGDLYHSIYTELGNQWNCLRYIDTLFHGSDRLKSLYRSIISNRIVADLL